MPNYLITGATSGLGLQVARRLARRGDNHLILPVRDAARGSALRSALEAAGRVRVFTPQLDLASLKGVATFVRGKVLFIRSRADARHRPGTEGPARDAMGVAQGAAATGRGPARDEHAGQVRRVAGGTVDG